MWSQALLFYKQPCQAISHDFTTAGTCPDTSPGMQRWGCRCRKPGYSMYICLDTYCFHSSLQQPNLLILCVCVCVLQGSSAPVIRRQKETMASWTRSRLCGGSVRTLASSAEIPTASLCSVLGSERLVSAF